MNVFISAAYSFESFLSMRDINYSEFYALKKGFDNQILHQMLNKII